MKDTEISRRNTPHSFSLWSGGIIFLSAFLLFQVQLVMGKLILPWFGGSPMVWTTSMLFFQVMLLVGYGYAHGITRLATKYQLAVHISLLILALVLLPITPDAIWKPTDSSQPVNQILLLLFVHIGLPFFLLAATAPLIQVWYQQVYVDRSPYRLYALSNVGSLLALLTYPFLFETTFASSTQANLWSGIFGLFVLGLSYLGWQLWQVKGRIQISETTTAQISQTSEGENDQQRISPSWWHIALWLILPAWASMLLLATTNHVSQDIAVIPFLWIVPLAIYLLSFIISFDSPLWYRRGIFSWVMVGLLLLLSFSLGEELFLSEQLGLETTLIDLDNILYAAGIYYAILFVSCMLCHGELVRLKPAPHYLTSFYLLLSTGGAIGGVLVALISPNIFSAYFELNIGLIGSYLLAIMILIDVGRRGLETGWGWGILSIAVIALVVGGWVWQAQVESIAIGTELRVRNFYGVLYVDEYDEDDPETHRREFYHGLILHGVQYQAPERSRWATAYYIAESGVGQAFWHYPRRGRMKVGIVGLGAGALAAYGLTGDEYRFYEINPLVVDISRDYFTFLEQSLADTEVLLGDARITMEREEPQNYDILVLDAFSGDAIPVHLLTDEAFALYLTHLKPEGIIAVHVSNIYLDLRPVVATIAAKHNLQVLEIDIDDPGGITDAGSTWMLVTNNEKFLQNATVQKQITGHTSDYPSVSLWTDQYSNLFAIFDP